MNTSLYNPNTDSGEVNNILIKTMQNGTQIKKELANNILNNLIETNLFVYKNDNDIIVGIQKLYTDGRVDQIFV